MSDKPQATRADDEEIKRGAFAEVPLDAIRRSTTNPRKRFDETALAELTESIRTKGLVQPLLVRPVPQDGEVLFELVAGERRFRACTTLKMQEVSCYIRVLTDQQALELQIIENLQRDDLDPLEEAEGYEKLIAFGQMDAAAIAVRINKKKWYVYDSLQLLALPKSGRAALLEGRLGRRQAVQIAGLPHADLREEALRIVLDPKGCKISELQNKYWHREKLTPLTFVETLELIRERYMRSLGGAPFDQKDATLNPKMGPCTTCPLRAGNDPDRFPDLRADMCTDMKCFNAKREAHNARLVAEAEAKGQKVLSRETVAKTFNHYSGKVSLRSDSPYVALDDTPGYGELAEYNSKAKWRSLVKGKDVPIVVAVDEDGGVHELLDHKLALTAAKENKPELFKKRGSSPGTAADKAAATKRKNENAIAAIAFDLTIDELVGKIEKGEKFPVPYAEALLAAAIEDTESGSYMSKGEVATYARVLNRRGFQWAADDKDGNAARRAESKALETYRKSLSTSQAIAALALELCLTEDEGVYGGNGLRDALCVAYKIDPKKIETKAKAIFAEKEKATAEAKKKPGEKPDLFCALLGVIDDNGVGYPDSIGQGISGVLAAVKPACLTADEIRKMMTKWPNHSDPAKRFPAYSLVAVKKFLDGPAKKWKGIKRVGKTWQHVEVATAVAKNEAVVAA